MEETSHHLFRMSFVVLLRKTVISRRQRQTMALNINVSVVANAAIVCLEFLTPKYPYMIWQTSLYIQITSPKQDIANNLTFLLIFSPRKIFKKQWRLNLKKNSTSNHFLSTNLYPKDHVYDNVVQFIQYALITYAYSIILNYNSLFSKVMFFSWIVIKLYAHSVYLHGYSSNSNGKQITQGYSFKNEDSISVILCLDMIYWNFKNNSQVRPMILATRLKFSS